MAEQRPTDLSTSKAAGKVAPGALEASPAGFTLSYGGKPLPAPVPRVTPLTARRPAAAVPASPAGKTGTPTTATGTSASKAKPDTPKKSSAAAPAPAPTAPVPAPFELKQAKGDASAADATSASQRPNPLTGRRSLPAVAVISAAEPPPPVRTSPDDAGKAQAEVHPATQAAAIDEAAEPQAQTADEAVAPPPDDWATHPSHAAEAAPVLAAPSPVASERTGALPAAAMAWLNPEQRARLTAPPKAQDKPQSVPLAAAAMAALASRHRDTSSAFLEESIPAQSELASQTDDEPAAASEVSNSLVVAAALATEAIVEKSDSVDPAVEPTTAPVATPAPAAPASAEAEGSPSQMLDVRPPILPRNGPNVGARPVISVRAITKIYTMGDVEVAALRGVDLDIFQGEMTAIMGPSGSGKSTLMNIIGCLDVPTSGVYLLDGEDVSRMKDDELADVRGRKIGFVFQSFNLLARTSALANVELPLLYSGTAGRSRHKKAQEVLDLVGLGSRMHHRPNELSGGQQQRVAIARALINEPAMILADEPTGNLDSKTSVEIMELFQRLNTERGITIIFVTHNLETADYCNRVVHVRDGHVERDVRHQPRAGIYRDLLPEDLPLEVLHPTAQGDPIGSDAAGSAQIQSKVAA